MVLPCANGALSRIAAVCVAAGWCALRIDAFFLHAFLENLGAFVVQAMQLGFEAGGVKAFDDACMSLFDGVCRSRRDALDKDAVAVAITEQENTLVATTRRWGEFACWIRKSLSGNGQDIRVGVMRAFVWRIRRRKSVGHDGFEHIRVDAW